MLIFKRLIHSASRGFTQWVELHYDDMNKLHPPWPLPPAVSGAATGQSRPGCGGRRGVGRAAGGWAEAHGGGPGKTHGGVIITCLQDCRSGLIRRQSYKKILTLPTIQLKLAIMFVFTTLTTSMRHRVFCLVAMAGDNYKIRQSLQDQLILQMYHTYLTLRIVEKI